MPRLQQLVLGAEHGGVLFGLGVVIPEQVQDPVHAEQLELVLGGVASLDGLFGRDLRAQHHVPEQARVVAGLRVARAVAGHVRRA